MKILNHCIHEWQPNLYLQRYYHQYNLYYVSIYTCNIKEKWDKCSSVKKIKSMKYSALHVG